MTTIRLSLVALLVAAAVLTARPALAGPPLLCFPFDIGHARSLPMAPSGWREIDAKYDVSRLVADTVGLLGPDTPVIVRMETLRRATIYAGTSQPLGQALFKTLEERAKAAQPNAALSVFDFGYLVETYRQALPMFKNTLVSVDNVDGYALVRKALMFRPDAEIEFAAAVISAHPRTADHDAHLRNAVTGATDNSLLAQNLVSHFSEKGRSLAQLRAATK